MAAGFSCRVEKIPALISSWTNQLKENADKSHDEKVYYYDTAISASGLNFEAINFVKNFEPFGAGNPKPVYLLQDVKVLSVRTIKDKHILITFADDEQSLSGIAFNCIGTEFGNHLLSLNGKTCSFLITADIEFYKDQPRVKIIVEDVII
jgi:single-stranded-DNA-specific exonuclease